MAERPDFITLQHNSTFEAKPCSKTFFGRGPHTLDKYKNIEGAAFAVFERIRTGDLGATSRVIFSLDVDENGGLSIVRLSDTNKVGLFGRGEYSWSKDAEWLSVNERYVISPLEDVCIDSITGSNTGILMIPTVLVSKDFGHPREFRVCIGGQNIHPNNCG